MNSSRIEELKRRKEQTYKKKKKQYKYGIVLFVVSMIIFVFSILGHAPSGWTWMIGLVIGYTLQRSRFCFTASFRDPILVGSTAVMRAVLVAFIIMTIGLGVLQVFKWSLGPVGLVEPVGLNTAIGAMIFGIGMVIAGGCASGTLMRIGEGFVLQIVVLMGFIIGALMAASNFEVLDKVLIQGSIAIYIPDILGFGVTHGLQLIVLVVLYVLLERYDNKHSMLVD